MKTISVVSSKSRVGKTFYCVNLAKLLSLFGKKVLLVDLDFNSQGLTDFNKEQSQYPLTHLLMSDFPETTCQEVFANASGTFGFYTIFTQREEVNFARFYPEEVKYYSETINNFVTLLNTAKQKEYDYVIFDTCEGCDILTLSSSILSNSNVFISDFDIGNLTMTNHMRKSIYNYKNVLKEEFTKEKDLAKQCHPFFRHNSHRYLFINLATNENLPQYDYVKTFVEYTVNPYEEEVASFYRRYSPIIADGLITDSYKIDIDHIKYFYTYNIIKSLQSLALAIGNDIPRFHLDDRKALENIHRHQKLSQGEKTLYFQEEIKKRQEHISSLRARMDGMGNSLASAAKRHSKLRSEIEELENSKNFYSQKVEVLSLEKKQQEEEHQIHVARTQKEYQDKVDGLQKDIAKTNEELFKSGQENEKIEVSKREQAIAAEQEKIRLTQDNGSKQEQIENLEKQLSETTANYKETKEALAEEKERHLRIVEGKNKDVLERDTKINELQESVGEKSLNKIANLTGKIERLEALAAKITSQLEVDFNDESVEDIVKQCLDMRVFKKSLAGCPSAARIKLEELPEKFEEHVTTVAGSSKRLKKLENELHMTLSRKNELEEKNKELEEKISDNELRIEHLSTELEEAKNELTKKTAAAAQNDELKKTGIFRRK